MLLGESGVGKSVFARRLHNQSYRSKEPFIEVNCSTIPESLFESEMFGYEAGSFTGAQKQGNDKGHEELDATGTILGSGLPFFFHYIEEFDPYTNIHTFRGARIDIG